MLLFKHDIMDVSYSEPKNHVVNFYFEDRMVHRVFEPTFKRHLFIPQRGDWISIQDVKYRVQDREIKYLPDSIVASVYLDKL